MNDPSLFSPEDRMTAPWKGALMAAAGFITVIAALFALHPLHTPTMTHIGIAIAVYILMTLHLWTQIIGESIVIVVITLLMACFTIPMMFPGSAGAKRCMITITLFAALLASRGLRRYVDGESWID